LKETAEDISIVFIVLSSNTPCEVRVIFDA
jgi:hypothetical protein